MDKNVRVIYKKVTEKFKKNGYINLNHRLVNTKDDLVDIATIFRNPNYETFRVIYMKDKKIAGYESISSKTPISVPLFRSKKNDYTNFEKGFYQVKDRMKRLNANGYFMVHNHPSGNARASSEDIKVTKEFIKNVDGFLGHLIVGTDEYAWIDKDEKSYQGVTVDNNQPINFKKVDKFSKMMKKKSEYDVQISTRTDLISFVKRLNSTKDYSIAIMTDATNRVRMILDVPNTMLNQGIEQLNGFFRNQGKLSGATKVLFATTDNDTFKRSLEHLNYGTFTDSICYKEIENNKIALCDVCKELPKRELFEKDKHPKSMPLINFGGMFVNNNKELVFQDSGTIDYKETDDGYIEIPVRDIDRADFLDIEDSREPSENEIKVLLKRVGKDPVVKIIPNTLQAKQKLVGGLIEVVPYEDALLICNEEGKILNMKPNLSFDYDYIAGDCFIIGDDYEHGDFKSLTKEQINYYKNDLKNRSFREPSHRGYSKQEEEKEL